MEVLTITDGYRVRHLNARAIARFAGVHVTTARRWLAGTLKPSPHAWRVMELRALGRIPFKGWRGFAFDDGCVYTPAGDRLTPSMLEHHAMLCQMARGVIREGREAQTDDVQALECEPGSPLRALPGGRGRAEAPR